MKEEPFVHINFRIKISLLHAYILLFKKCKNYIHTTLHQTTRNVIFIKQSKNRIFKIFSLYLLIIPKNV
jgi:hypothetical protein